MEPRTIRFVMTALFTNLPKSRLVTNWIDSSGASTAAGAKPNAPKLMSEANAKMPKPHFHTRGFWSVPVVAICCSPSA